VISLREVHRSPRHLLLAFDARYEALTIVSLMGHKDLKTTMRYIRAVQLQRDVRPLHLVHKLATNEIRPPVMAAVNY
jgi:integrase